MDGSLNRIMRHLAYTFFIIGTLVFIASVANATTTGQYAYVTSYSDNIVSVINTTTNMVVGNITVGDTLWGIAASPDGTKIYVTN